MVGAEVLLGVMVGAFVVFLLGMKRYRKESPKGSPFTTIAQVLVAASRKWHIPNNGNYWYDQHHDHGDSYNPQIQPKVHTLVHINQYRYPSLFCFIVFTLLNDDLQLSYNARNLIKVVSLKLIMNNDVCWIIFYKEYSK